MVQVPVISMSSAFSMTPRVLRANSVPSEQSRPNSRMLLPLASPAPMVKAIADGILERERVRKNVYRMMQSLIRY